MSMWRDQSDAIVEATTLILQRLLFDFIWAQLFQFFLVIIVRPINVYFFIRVFVVLTS